MWPVRARLHAPDRLLGAVDDGVEVELELADDASRRLVLEAAPSGMIPALLTSDVERAELALDVVEEGGEAGAVGDVEGEADRAAAELGGGGLGGGEVDVADRHAGARAARAPWRSPRRCRGRRR